MLGEKGRRAQQGMTAGVRRIGMVEVSGTSPRCKGEPESARGPGAEGNVVGQVLAGALVQQGSKWPAARRLTGSRNNTPQPRRTPWARMAKGRARALPRCQSTHLPSRCRFTEDHPAERKAPLEQDESEEDEAADHAVLDTALHLEHGLLCVKAQPSVRSRAMMQDAGGLLHGVVVRCVSSAISFGPARSSMLSRSTAAARRAKAFGRPAGPDSGLTSGARSSSSSVLGPDDFNAAAVGGQHGHEFIGRHGVFGIGPRGGAHDVAQLPIGLGLGVFVGS